MEQPSKPTVWHDANRTRHFLIPNGLDLSPGELRLRNLLGAEREVAEKEVLEFEVSKEEADAFVRAQLGEVFGEAKERFLRFMQEKREEWRIAMAERKKERQRNRAERPRPFTPEAVSQVFERVIEDLPEPEKQKVKTTGEALKTTFAHVGTFLKAAGKGDVAGMQAAKERMEELRDAIAKKEGGEESGKKGEQV